jgi:hypothetical protein
LADQEKKCPSISIKQLFSDKKKELCEAKIKVEKRIVIEDKDFLDQAGATIDIPERRKSQRVK